MTSFRFLHCSDLHLGKRFGRLPEEVRAALQQARQQSISRLAAVARDHQARHVLIAGDMFDTETPSDRVLRQALAAMGAATELNWWIIPGNHDSAAAEPLWAAMAEHAADNVHPLLHPGIVEIATGVQLLAAPCRHRFAADDLTRWMDQAETPAQHLRIGLAHGGVLDFGSDEAGGEIIAPDRAAKARLDYLALGDWHGRFRLDARSHYSGTAEADRFKHAGKGQALLVELAEYGAMPAVTEIETGIYHWCEQELELTPTITIGDRFRDILPEDRTQWHQYLLRFKATGWVTAAQRMELQSLSAELGPEFCYFDLDESGLRSEHQLEDLDLIATGGALRVTAEELLQSAADASLAQADRDVASAALNRLFAYAQQGAQSDVTGREGHS